MILIDQMRDQFARTITQSGSIDAAFRSAVIRAYEIGMRDGRDQVLLDGQREDAAREAWARYPKD